MPHFGEPVIPPRQQSDAVIMIPNPANFPTRYPILTARNARIISIMAYVEWTAQPELHVYMVADDLTVAFSHATPISATNYYANMRGQAALGEELVTPSPHRAFILEARDIYIDAYLLGGTSQYLYCIVRWARW